MRILLLTHSFNGLAQRLFCALRADGHAVSVEFDIADSVTEEAVALWRPDGTVKAGDLPPPPADVEGFGDVITRGMENRVVAYGILAGVMFCVVSAATAGPTPWRDYGTLFFMSRFVHVTTVDFMTLTLLAPFWMENDARLRRWEGVGDWRMTGLQCLPVLGPAVYLCLRPVMEKRDDDDGKW